MEHEAVTWPLFAWPINAPALRHGGGEISYENYRTERRLLSGEGGETNGARLTGELVLNWPPMIFFLLSPDHVPDFYVPLTISVKSYFLRAKVKPCKRSG